MDKLREWFNRNRIKISWHFDSIRFGVFFVLGFFLYLWSGYPSDMSRVIDLVVRLMALAGSIIIVSGLLKPYEKCREEDCKMEEPLPPDWKVEYKQLSEDNRLFVSLGWQATVAALAVDGLVLGSARNLKNPVLFSLVTLMAGSLTILMGLETNKWRMRNKKRIERLAYYDQRRGFKRFYRKEKGFLTWPLGEILFILMMLVGWGMTIYAIYVMAFPGSWKIT